MKRSRVSHDQKTLPSDHQSGEAVIFRCLHPDNIPDWTSLSTRQPARQEDYPTNVPLRTAQEAVGSVNDSYRDSENIFLITDEGLSVHTGAMYPYNHPFLSNNVRRKREANL
jgi:hypothetical protein